MDSHTADPATLGADTQSQPSLYDAFLSYDHDDTQVAYGIQRGLHRIGRRVGRLYALRVFRDSTDLTASPDLWGKVTEAMDRSRYLIAVLSPNAAASTWVNKEVAYWLEHRGPAQLMFVLAGGSLDWDAVGTRFDPDRSNAAIPVLSTPGVLPTEPLYVDVSDDAPWDPAAARFRDMLTDLAAPIHGKPKYELASEDLREQHRFRRLRRAAIAALTLLTIVALVAAGIAYLQRQEAVRQRNAADTRFREATASRLATESQAMLTGAHARDDVRAIQEALASQRVSDSRDAGPLIRALGYTSETRKIIRVGAPFLQGMTLDPTNSFDSPTNVAFSPDGRRIVTGGKRIRLWEADTARPLFDPTGYAVYSVAYSPDGHRIASGGHDQAIQLWDADSGQPVGAPLTGHTGMVSAVAFSPDGRVLVSASTDGTVRLWNVETRAAVGVVDGDGSAVNSVAFGPNGRRLVSGSAKGTVSIVDAETRSVLKSWAVGNEVKSVAFGPDNRVVSGDTGGFVRVYDAATGQQFDPLPIGSENEVDAVALSPGGHLVAFGGFDQNVNLWDLDTRSPARTPLAGHTGRVWSVAFSKDGSRIASASFDGTARIWDPRRLSGGRPVLGPPEVNTPPLVPRSTALAPDSHRMAAGFSDGTVMILDTDTGQRVGPTFAGHVGRVTATAFSPDARRVASGGDDGAVRFWELSSGNGIATPTEHGGPVVKLLFSPDGKRVASQSDGTGVRLWDPDTGRAVGPPMRGYSGKIWSMAFSPDGRLFATGGDDSTVRLWDAETGEPIGEPMMGHESTVLDVAFGDHGHHLVSMSLHSLYVWDVNSRTPVGKPRYPDPNSFGALAVSPDGSFFVTSGFGTMQRWNAATGAPIGTPMFGHTALVLGIDITGDENYIVSGSDDFTLRYWDAHTGQPVGDPLVVPNMLVSQLSVGRDGGRVLSWTFAPPSAIVSSWAWPGPASWHDDLCAKMSFNMSRKQWDEWVSRDIPYVTLCPDLPELPDNPG
jgi:WD40 repeat protein